MARRPLAWLILLEALLVAALAAATYHVLSTRPAPPPAVAAAPAPAGGTPAAPKPKPPPPAPQALTPQHPKLGPPPGFNLDPAFWGGQLQRINQDQRALAELQLKAAGAVTAWVRAYVEHVLVPAVQEAEKT